jgi:hypothetical protein
VGKVQETWSGAWALELHKHFNQLLGTISHLSPALRHRREIIENIGQLTVG